MATGMYPLTDFLCNAHKHCKWVPGDCVSCADAKADFYRHLVDTAWNALGYVGGPIDDSYNGNETLPQACERLTKELEASQEAKRKHEKNANEAIEQLESELSTVKAENTRLAVGYAASEHSRALSEKHIAWMRTESQQVLRDIANPSHEYWKNRGCGDGNCIVYKPEGQHTNGGCKCGTRLTNKDWGALKLRWVIELAKRALSGNG